MKDISEKRLSDYMAEQIADEILSGRIPGGSQLKQEELAEAFEASRIPIREAFQILENQGLIIRLATRRITVTELDKEQICLIYSMISEMTKKALNSLKHSGKTAQLEEMLMTSGVSGEVQPAEAMCDLVENEYILPMMYPQRMIRCIHAPGLPSCGKGPPSRCWQGWVKMPILRGRRMERPSGASSP